jgi:hypothetical protein
MASANDSYPETNLSEVASLFRVSLIFNNVSDWNGDITFYDEFTTNKTYAMENGVQCPPSRCYYSNFDPITHTLRVDVSNFSTYVVNYTVWNGTNDTNVTPPEDDSDMTYDFLIDEGCAGEATTFSLSRNNAELEGFPIRIYGPDSSTLLYARLETNSSGVASFIPAEAGTYYYEARESGYRLREGSFSIEECEVPPVHPPEQVEPPPETGQEPETGAGNASQVQPPTEEPATQCGEYINGAWVSYECCSDTECGAGYCIQHMCTTPSKPHSGETTTIGAEGETGEGAAQTAQPKPSSCCLAGICGELLGICWYFWALLILLVVGAAIAYSLFGQKAPEEEKPAERRKK